LTQKSVLCCYYSKINFKHHPGQEDFGPGFQSAVNQKIVQAAWKGLKSTPFLLHLAKITKVPNFSFDHSWVGLPITIRFSNHNPAEASLPKML
jgi:hypothetical protein